MKGVAGGGQDQPLQFRSSENGFDYISLQECLEIKISETAKQAAVLRQSNGCLSCLYFGHFAVLVPGTFPSIISTEFVQHFFRSTD